MLYRCSILGYGAHNKHSCPILPYSALYSQPIWIGLVLIIHFTSIISLYIICSLLRDNLAKGWIPGFYFLL